MRNIKMRLAACSIALLSLLPAFPAAASQGGCLPTSGIYGGLTAAGYINGAIEAVQSMNSGSAAPANHCSGLAVAGQLWLDTGNAQLAKVYDGTSWLTIGKADSSTHIWNGVIGGGSTTLASATTTDLGSVSNANITISGTTPITSFGSTVPSGQMKVLGFSGITTITYNSTSMQLPTAASITTTVGDSALAMSLGSGNWKVVAYTRADGTSIVQPTIATNRLMGNNSGSTAQPSALTPTQATAMLDIATASVKGLAPAWPNNTTTFLRGDGSYAAIPPVSSSVAGLMPAFPNTTSTFLRGDGTYANTSSIGGRVLLATLTASNSAALQDTTSFTSTYKFYEVEYLNLVPSTNNNLFNLQVYSGGSYRTTGYINYVMGYISSGSNVNAGSTNAVMISTNSIINTDPGSSGKFTVYDPSTSHIVSIRGKSSDGFNSGVTMYYGLSEYGGQWNTSAPVTGFQIVPTSGVITSGSVRIYGYN